MPSNMIHTFPAIKIDEQAEIVISDEESGSGAGEVHAIADDIVR